MNWEAIGAIAELLGAAGVIISLVYLAVQIRQNTHSVRMASHHGIADQFTQTTRVRSWWSSGGWNEMFVDSFRLAVDHEIASLESTDV